MPCSKRVDDRVDINSDFNYHHNKWIFGSSSKGTTLDLFAKWTEKPSTIDKLTATVTGSTVNISWSTTGTFASFDVTLTNKVGSVFYDKTLGKDTKNVEIKGVYANSYVARVVGEYSTGNVAKQINVKVALSPAANPVHFTDIANLHPAYQKAIDWMAKYKITTGDGKGHYLPNDSITREQMALFIWKLVGQPVQTEPDVPLHDISNLGTVSQVAIKWLASTGITVGDGEGHYMPKDHVTREQMAVFMWKLSGKNPKSGAKHMNFNDISSLGKVSQQAIEWIASYSITVGNGDGGYMPADYVTRGNMALFMSKLGNTLRNY